jgi:hypothetical protein
MVYLIHLLSNFIPVSTKEFCRTLDCFFALGERESNALALCGQARKERRSRNGGHADVLYHLFTKSHPKIPAQDLQLQVLRSIR